MKFTALVPTALILAALSRCAAEGAPSRYLHGGKKRGATKKGGKKTIVVHPGESIQDSIDIAQPWDKVKVLDGTYVLKDCDEFGFNSKNYGLGIFTDHLTLMGSKHAIIDASACLLGIKVGSRPSQGECPTTANVTGVKIKGFSILGGGESSENTVAFINAEDYEISGSNLEGGSISVFSRCSRGGLIKHNYITGEASGSGISVKANTADVVEKNTITNHVFAILVQNSQGMSIEKNKLEANTNGIYLNDACGIECDGICKEVPSKNILIQNNHIRANNMFTNVGSPFPPPLGIGIFNYGSDEVTIRKNTIIDNDSFGVLLLANPNKYDEHPDDPFLGVYADHNIVKENKFSGNGAHPDPLVRGIFMVLDDVNRTVGADISYVPVAINFLDPSNPIIDKRKAPYTNCFDLGTGGGSKRRQSPAGMPVSTYIKIEDGFAIEDLACSKKSGSNKHTQTKRSNTGEQSKLHQHH